MNQFRLDLDATRCAQAHQDAHCGKMLLELVQQLCTAFPRPTHVFDLKLTPWADLSPETRIEINALPYDRTKAQYSRQAAAKARPVAAPARPAAVPRRPTIEVVDAEVDGLSRSEAFAALFGRAFNGGC